MSRTFDQTILGSMHGISLAKSGCGPCSLASIVYNHDTAITPEKVAEYLYNLGAFMSEGTTRSGISQALSHYGFDSQYFTPEHAGGTIWQNAVARMRDLDAAGTDFYVIFLVVSANGNSYWTAGGHYISSTAMDGTKVYVRDSGGRRRTGWHDLSELQYVTNCIWIVTEPEDGKYSGELPTVDLKRYTDQHQQTKLLQNWLNWYGGYGLTIDGEFGKRTESAVMDFQTREGLTVDGIVGRQSRKKMSSVTKM